jgi:hypothetical protein
MPQLLAVSPSAEEPADNDSANVTRDHVRATICFCLEMCFHWQSRFCLILVLVRYRSTEVFDHLAYVLSLVGVGKNVRTGLQ